ncbi:MAG TPA: pyridoxal-phosphate dependent enzyme [Opitutaceae bacterium]|nr:pyridoxal-phosphate dependent enzyme [Opitutaceae bacterium]
MSEIAIEDIREAHARIRERIHRTPVLTSARLDELSGGRLFFKCENFQKTGSFKARGATNAVLSLADAEAARGVATHSSGNHAAALAWAAGLRGIPAFIAMPRTVSRVKLASVERLGGRVVLCEPTHEAREAAADRIVRETGAAFIHPFDDPRVIAGQGTAALELMGDVPDLDIIVCPVGGGGLLAGTSIAAKALRPGIRLFAGEPEGAADASLSLASGVRRPVEHPSSIADGLLAFVGELAFPVIRRNVDAIATVSDDAIIAAMRQIWEIMKIAVEPSGAVAFAAIAQKKVAVAGRRVGVILSGGNVEFDALAGGR